MKYILLFLVFIQSTLFCSAQDYAWWNKKNNWDGVTPWSRYIVMSSAYMGPNALPVPELKNGTIKNSLSLELGGDVHVSKGDNTQNLFTQLYIPITKNKIGINISYIPIEWYQTDTNTRDLRHAREESGNDISFGDVYIATHIQLIKDKKKLPDVLLTINLKTASGTNMSSARYTDAPGYFFDVSFGKKIIQNDSSIFQYLKLYSMLGFYVYQTNRSDYFQNDAIMYGAGFDIGFSKLQISNQLTGYKGYIGNGDKPLVYRLAFKTIFKSHLNYSLLFQRGLNDFDYSTFRFSMIYNFNNPN